MTTTSKLLNSYKNGSYFVEIFSDGTKIRQKLQNDTEVVDFPESIDLKITNFCDMAKICVFCHEKSNLKGVHGDSKRIIEFCKGLPAGAEIAIGGGNPLSHPDIEVICSKLTSMGIIVNMTINQMHTADFFGYKNEKLRKTIHGVGISYREKDNIDSVRSQLSYSHLKSNVIWHLILGIHTIEDVMFLSRNFTSPKILWLGYKEVGNGIPYNKKNHLAISENIQNVYNGLDKIQKHIGVLAFDNLAIAQLHSHKIFSTGDYMGDDGQFSFYFDAVKDEYAIGSSSKKRISAVNKNAIECFKEL